MHQVANEALAWTKCRRATCERMLSLSSVCPQFLDNVRVSAVPEPSTLALFGILTLGALGRATRRWISKRIEGSYAERYLFYGRTEELKAIGRWLKSLWTRPVHHPRKGRARRLANIQHEVDARWSAAGQKQYAESEPLRLRGDETARNNDAAVE